MTDNEALMFVYSMNFPKHCLIMNFKIWKPDTVAYTYNPRFRGLRQEGFHMVNKGQPRMQNETMSHKNKNINKMPS